ncbi:YfcC family protein [Wenzhouxiangella limi]|uniref:YfcC family protein n=1 Tax=Wenzhouxiangella limi TaxID=2707351 RepID=A0A845URX6_9GAMM|nr:AbgT family transporter [Wenzhouxiangella limi]NDY94593.1 YfcC family protein [Wenzhouxiangella limi]
MSARFRVPHTLVLMFAMMIAALVLTWVLPAGQFQTEMNEAGREIVVPGTYTAVEDEPALSPWTLFTVVPRALADAQGIIFFVLIIGGALAIIRKTGAIDAILDRLIRRFGRLPWLLILGGMLAFGIASATLGMAEEYIPFAAILIALCVSLRMDTMTAIGIMVVGYGIGYGVALINPFTLLVAQEVAELQPGSGMGYRLALWLPFFAVGFHHVWRYAKRVQADPQASLVADVASAQPPAPSGPTDLTPRRALVLAATLAALTVLVIGIARFGWYLVELGAVFLLLAIVTGLIARLRLDDIAETFVKGASELAGTAMLIGFARSIALILEDGLVLHTIVNGLATPLGQLPAALSAVGMLGIQSLLNLFIPSGSGQAFVTMPLMAPIGDLVGVSRQVAVLAFQFGDGFMNMVVPTNPVLMSIIGLAGIPYERWFRFIFPLILKLLALAAAALIVGVWIGY